MVWLHEQGYAKTTIARRLAAVRSWFRFLCRRGVLTANPADGLRGPRQDKKLPHFLPEDTLGKLLAAPSPQTLLGRRDRAILETLYSAGLRVSELTGLNLGDLDRAEGVATVRGKGKKERLVFFGAQALEALEAWLQARAELLDKLNKQPAGRHKDAVFLNKNGTRLTPRSVGRLLAKYLAASRPRPGRQPAQLAAQLRDAPARSRRRHPQRAGTAGPPQPGDHPDLHPRDHGPTEGKLPEGAPEGEVTAAKDHLDRNRVLSEDVSHVPPTPFMDAAGCVVLRGSAFLDGRRPGYARRRPGKSSGAPTTTWPSSNRRNAACPSSSTSPPTRASGATGSTPPPSATRASSIS